MSCNATEKLRRCTRRYSSQRDEFHHTTGTTEMQKRRTCSEPWGGGCRAATTPPAKRGNKCRATQRENCAAARGAARRSATSSTTRLEPRRCRSGERVPSRGVGVVALRQPRPQSGRNNVVQRSGKIAPLHAALLVAARRVPPHVRKLLRYISSNQDRLIFTNRRPAVSSQGGLRL